MLLTGPVLSRVNIYYYFINWLRVGYKMYEHDLILRLYDIRGQSHTRTHDQTNKQTDHPKCKQVNDILMGHRRRGRRRWALELLLL